MGCANSHQKAKDEERIKDAMCPGGYRNVPKLKAVEDHPIVQRRRTSKDKTSKDRKSDSRGGSKASTESPHTPNSAQTSEDSSRVIEFTIGLNCTIGLNVRIVDMYPLTASVIGVEGGSLAESAGAQEGDNFLELNGISIHSMTQESFETVCNQRPVTVRLLSSVNEAKKTNQPMEQRMSELLAWCVGDAFLPISAEGETVQLVLRKSPSHKFHTESRCDGSADTAEMGDVVATDCCLWSANHLSIEISRPVSQPQYVPLGLNGSECV